MPNQCGNVDKKPTIRADRPTGCKRRHSAKSGNIYAHASLRADRHWPRQVAGRLALQCQPTRTSVRVGQILSDPSPIRAASAADRVAPCAHTARRTQPAGDPGPALRGRFKPTLAPRQSASLRRPRHPPRDGREDAGGGTRGGGWRLLRDAPPLARPAGGQGPKGRDRSAGAVPHPPPCRRRRAGTAAASPHFVRRLPAAAGAVSLSLSSRRGRRIAAAVLPLPLPCRRRWCITLKAYTSPLSTKTAEWCVHKES